MGCFLILTVGVHGAITNSATLNLWGYIMETKLMPIFELRAACLQNLSPKYYAQNADLIRRTSLAAQDYVISGNIYEYNNINGAISFDKLPEYINVHAKYNLPFNAFARPFEQNGLNPGLVMDLAQALKSDELNNIIDTRGNIINTNKLFSSKVLRIYHNSPMLSGIPLFALRKVLTSTRTMQVSR